MRTAGRTTDEERRKGRVVKLGIVVAEFDPKITQRMLRQAIKRSAELPALVTYICKVPGAYDMPLIIQDLLQKEDIDAVVTLGAVVKGETNHDEVIADKLASKAAELALRYGKPVTLGVSGPSMTRDQAMARIDEYANRSVDAAVKMVQRHRRTTERLSKTKYPVVIE